MIDSLALLDANPFHNRRALGVYHAAGFKQATYQPEAGGSLFFTKPL